MNHPLETCAEVENSLPLFVGGDLEREAIAATEAHLRECARCAAKAAQAREAHGLLVSALRLTTTRGPDLWAGVRAVLAEEGLIHAAGQPADKRVAGGATGTIARPLGRRWIAWGAAVAAAVLFGFWLGSRALTDDTPRLERFDRPAELVNQRPGSAAIPTLPVAGPGLRRVRRDEAPLRDGADFFYDAAINGPSGYDSGSFDPSPYDPNRGAPAGLRQVRPNR